MICIILPLRFKKADLKKVKKASVWELTKIIRIYNICSYVRKMQKNVEK